MRNPFKKPSSPVDESINQVLLELEDKGPDHPDYERHQKQLKVLYKLKAEDRPMRVDPNIALQTGTHLIGILAILNFEKAGVVLSKAMTMLPMKLLRK